MVSDRGATDYIGSWSLFFCHRTSFLSFLPFLPSFLLFSFPSSLPSLPSFPPFPFFPQGLRVDARNELQSPSDRRIAEAVALRLEAEVSAD